MGVKIDPNDVDLNHGFQKLLREQHPEIYESKEPVVEESKHKYNAKKVEYDGIVFDSKRECYMYQLLKRVEWIGGSYFKMQENIILQEKINDKDMYYNPDTCSVSLEDFCINEASVIPDFVIYSPLAENQFPLRRLIIDTKGFQTQKSVLQMKLLRTLVKCPILLPTTNKHCDQIFQMLSEGIFANIKFEKPKKKGVKK
jgi:hypothetical protein